VSSEPKLRKSKKPSSCWQAKAKKLNKAKQAASNVPNVLGVSSYLYTQRAPSWRAPSVIESCYSSKGKVFFRTFDLEPSSISQFEFVILTN
jgi:hypothetical protein